MDTRSQFQYYQKRTLPTNHYLAGRREDPATLPEVTNQLQFVLVESSDIIVCSH
jgi:hypothetical protein